jgi:hypothetical protein
VSMQRTEEDSKRMRFERMICYSKYRDKEGC